MGIDLIKGGRIANRGFRKTKSSNSYLKSLINVTIPLVSSTPSSPEEQMLNSIKSFTKDSTNPDSIDIPSPSHASPNISPKTKIPTHKVIKSSVALSL